MRLNLLILSALLVCASAQNPKVPDTTTAAPDTTTAAPATTTAAPATTTAAPATTTAAPVTTTAAPVTTTAAPVPTTSAPAPAPVPPKSGHYVVTGANGTEVCLMMDVAMQFTVSYNISTGEIKTDYFNIPSNATATGNCSSGSKDTAQYVNLAWPGYLVTFLFENNVADKTYGLKCIALEFEFNNTETSKTVQGNAMSAQIDKDTEYLVSSGGSYKCVGKKNVDFVNVTTVGESGVNVTGAISGFKYEAFHDITEGKYSTEEECSLDFSTSDIVPIAVGCALAALVVIVLIAYLIGRRRSRQRGYQSV